MYRNYGDINFFEHGRLADTEHSDTEIHVLYCEPYSDQEDLYLFADCQVDLSDDWIDWNSIHAGCGEIKYCDPETEHAILAIAAIEYYGVENFSSPYEGYQFSKEEIKEKLRHYLIAYDNLYIQ